MANDQTKFKIKIKEKFSKIQFIASKLSKLYS
jgi:hypothetical protein